MADGVLSWQWVVLAMLALFVLAVGLRDLPENLAAARGEGVTGTFTAVDDLGCGRSLATGCSWSGSFEGEDRTIRVDDVHFDGRLGAIGDTARVRYIASGESGVVYQPDGDMTWAWNLGLIVATSSYLGAFVLALVKRSRRAT